MLSRIADMNALFHRALGLALVAAVVGGCATRSESPAPVVDIGRTPSVAVRPAAPVPAPTPAPVATPAPVVSAPAAGTATAAPPAPPRGWENAGKPGYYKVKPGETLTRIALESGQRTRDLVAWNQLENPNLIEVGQVLRVIPPGPDTPAASRPVAVASVTGQPLPAAGTPAPAASAPQRPASAPAAAVAVAAAPKPASDEELGFIWPTKNPVIANFDGKGSIGMDFSGKLGDPVIASADGQVIYAGAGLRGYGNFIIVKHNNTFLTAYANNQVLLVKEDQLVKKGQKIAEMGQSDSDKVKLHFEVRKSGKAIDPATVLPAR